jgi:hypothetical protein
MIIQIKGSNGSGKSTIMMGLLGQSDDVFYDEHKNTVLNDSRFVLIGPYGLSDSPTSNGCDNLSRNDVIKAAIEYAIQNYPGYTIVFEGMMISTIKSTYYNYLLDLKGKAGVEPLFVILKASLDGCIRRLKSRGSKKTGHWESVEAKCRGVISGAESYDQRYVRWMDVDNLTKEEMLPKFLEVIDMTEPMTYDKLRGMTVDEVDIRLNSLAVEDLPENLGERKRLLGTMEIPNLVYDRSDKVDPVWHGPWNHDVSIGEVGYMTSTGNVMSLWIQYHRMNKCDVPLYTDWEMVSYCADCKGSRGTCPGYAPRFERYCKSGGVWVLTISMDFAWGLKYAGLGIGDKRNIFMITSYVDAVTVRYIQRILGKFSNYRLLGAGGCPGKCHPCTVMDVGKCSKPSKRMYSVESVGVDCDWLHRILYGEWLPWAYRGHRVVPTYMTRYGMILTDDDVSGDIGRTVLEDQSAYDGEWTVPELETKIWEIPSGAHQGARQRVYMLDDDETNRG